MWKQVAREGTTRVPQLGVDELIALLEEGYRAGAKDGQYKATALVVDITTIPAGKSKKQDAIEIRLDHRDDYSVRVVFPYTFSAAGDLQVESPFAVAGDKAIFGR